MNKQDYGARVPLATLDADDFTLRKLVPIVRAGGVPGAESSLDGGSATATAAAGGAGVAVAGVPMGEVMIRDAPGR